MAFWQDLPNKTTPRNSENLSRSERYLTATAGLNGDFYVEIDGASGLATGDVIRISFPEATSSTADARLSIDGASGTFRNVIFKNTVTVKNITSKYIQSQEVSLYYNGTQWVAMDNESEWFAATLQNSWVNSGGTFEICSYKVIGNTVKIRGIVQDGQVGNFALFTLPTELQPANELIFIATSGFPTPSIAEIRVRSLEQTAPGEVRVRTGSNTLVGLGSLVFEL